MLRVFNTFVFESAVSTSLSKLRIEFTLERLRSIQPKMLYRTTFTRYTGNIGKRMKAH